MSARSRRPFVDYFQPLEPRRLLAGQLFAGDEVPVGTDPSSALVADFNADGKNDLAVVNSGAGTITLLLGDGRAGLSNVATYNSPAVNAAPQGIARADFNADGKIDLAVSNVNNTLVTLLYGQGNGQFTVSHLALNVAQAGINCADFTNDGKSDLAYTTLTSPGFIYVRPNLGNGFFGQAVQIATGPFPEHLASADFNNDGNADLVADSAGTTLTVALGNGNGTFAAPTTLTVPSGPTNPVPGDYNGDGKTDIAVASSGGTVAVLLGSGFGTFAAAPSVTVPANPAFMAATDFNLDGKTDLVVTGYQSKTITRLTGSGTGTFTAASLTPPRPAGSLAVGDFTGDGRADLVTTNLDAASVSILQATATAYETPARLAAGDGPTNVAAGDVTGDGRPDLVVANTTANTVNFYAANGAGGFATPLTYAVGAGPRGITTGDFNNDGRTDLAVANYNNGSGSTVSVLLNNSNVTFAPAITVACGAGPIDLAAVDLNVNGTIDLVTADAVANTLTRLINNGSGTAFTASTVPLPAGSTPTAVVAGRFNGDLYVDLAVACAGTDSVALLSGSIFGTYTTASLPVGDNPIDLAAADFDGNGNIDFAVANTGAGTVTVLLGQSGFTYPAASATTATAGAGPTAVAVADVNGDGRFDLGVVGGSTGLVTTLLNSGVGSFSQQTARAYAGASPLGLAAGDFDANGRTDFAATSSTNDTVTVLANRQRIDSPFVTAANGTVTVTGADVIVSLDDTQLRIATSAGLVYLDPEALSAYVFDNATGSLASDLGGANGSPFAEITLRNGSVVVSSVDQHLMSLLASDTSVFRLGQGYDIVLRTRGLTLNAAARLDLSDNDMVLDYSPFVLADFPAFVRGRLAGGRANGAWTGPGITSSSAKNQPNGKTTLGYMTAQEYRSVYGANATFEGELFDDTCVLVKYTTYGDADFSGTTNFNDFVRLQTAFGTAGRTTFGGDFDNNGLANFDDFVLLQTAFGAST